jgi:hypothetical protein
MALRFEADWLSLGVTLHKSNNSSDLDDCENVFRLTISLHTKHINSQDERDE